MAHFGLIRNLWHGLRGFRLKRCDCEYFMQKVNEVNVKRFFPEVLANHLENRAFQNECIVDGHHANAFHTIPAWLATTGDAHIHYVVGNEEICLELFAPGGIHVRTRCGQEGERGRDEPIRWPSRGWLP